MFVPLTFLAMWLARLLSLALLGGGAYLVYEWYIGQIIETTWLVIGAIMLAWSVAGRWLVLLTRRRGGDEPHTERVGRARRVAAPDRANLHVEEPGSKGNALTSCRRPI